MKSSAPSSIKGIDDETLEAARALADRSGLSVAEWLNRVIADHGGPETGSGRDADRAFHGNDQTDQAVAAAAERLTRRIRAMDATSRSALAGLKDRLDAIERNLGAVPTLPPGSGERARSLRSVAAMIEDLSRELDNADESARRKIEGLRDRGGSPTRGSERASDAGGVSDAIQDLDQRISAMTARIKPGPKVESPVRLDELKDRLDALLAKGPAAPAPQTERAASLDTALRSLESKIDSARARVIAGAPPTIASSEEDRMRRIEARLADIKGHLGAKAPQPFTPPPMGDNLASAIAEISARQKALDDKSETLDSVSELRRDIADLSEKMAAFGRVGAEEKGAFYDLVRRIDALGAERPLDRHLLSAMRADLDALRTAVSGDHGMTGIAQRLDGLIERMPERDRLDALGDELSTIRHALEAADGPRAISRLEVRMAELARGLETALNGDSKARRQAESETFARIEATLGKISTRIDSLVDRTPRIEVLTAIHDRVAALARGMEAANSEGRAHRQTENESFSQLAGSLGEINTRLDGLLDRSSQDDLLTAVHDRVASLARGVEAAVKGSVDTRPTESEAFSRLETTLNEVAARIDGLLDGPSHDMLTDVQARVAALADRLDRMDAFQRMPAATLDQIKGDILALRRDIAERTPPAIDHLEGQIADLAGRLDTLAKSSDDDGLAELEAQVARLSAELENVPQSAVLQKVEENLARVQSILSDNRTESVEAARIAARQAVNELAGRPNSDIVRALKDDLETLRGAAGATDVKTRETLGAVHETLAKVVERLARLEAGQEAGARTPARSGIEPTVPRAEPAVGWKAPVVVPGASEDNRPLEPGSGKPDLAALRELAGNTPKAPRERRPADRKADFIAAARRAAQAAAAETAPVQAVKEPEAEEPRNGTFARISQAIRSRRRPLLLAAAAIVLAIGALQLFGDRLTKVVEMASHARRPVSVAERAPAAPAKSTSVTVNAATPKIGEPALVVPPADGGSALAFTEPESFDGRFGSGLDGPSPQAFSIADPAPPPAVATSGPAIEPKRAALGGTGPVPQGTATAPAPDAGIGSTRLLDAASAGDPAAAFEVAVRYAEGRGVPADLKKAAEWYKRAAEGGVAVAQYRLGSLYERGQGVAKDTAAAATWYQRAADQGNVGAMHNLAVLMSEGVQGSGPDPAKALQWFQTAAFYGVKDSQYNLGVIYARGLGVTADMIEAYKWFAVAAAQGDSDAASRRDDVAKAMPPDDLAKARAAVASWHAKPALPEANAVPAPEGGWDEPATTLSASDQRQLVSKIQALLAEQGYDPGPADGVAGAKTKDAVRAFQKTIGVAETGEISKDLVAALSGRI
jgi:localization factor PodJL